MTCMDLDLPGFGDLFGETKDEEFGHIFGQMPEACGTIVWLLIMRAIGNCNTLEVIRLNFLKLTFQQLTALMDPLQTSFVLRELELHGNAIVDTNDGCNIIVELLKLNSSLRVLQMEGSRDRPPSILYYLAIHDHPTVENLVLGEMLEIEEMARIIQACPNLKRWPYKWTIDSEDTAVMYAQALIEHPTFCHVCVKGHARPVSSFLLSSCTRGRPVTSLIYLSVEDTGNGERLRRNVPMFLANRELEDLYFEKVLTFSEEWQRMVRSLKQNSVMRNVSLEEIAFDEDEGFNFPGWEELVAWLKEGSRLESLKISRGRGCQHDLRTLIEAITSFQSEIQSLLLGNFELSSNEKRALFSMIKENGPLTSLLFDFKNLGWKDALRYNSELITLGLSSQSRAITDSDLEALLAKLQNRAPGRILWDNTDILRNHELMEYWLQEKERQGVVTYAFLSTCTQDKLGYTRKVDGGRFKELLVTLQVNSSLEKNDVWGTNWNEERKRPSYDRHWSRRSGETLTWLPGKRGWDKMNSMCQIQIVFFFMASVEQGKPNSE